MTEQLDFKDQDAVRQENSYEEFEKKFKRLHTCGIPMIPSLLAFNSRCPKCEPEGAQWKDDCLFLWKANRVCRAAGYWYTRENL